jgi:hypothetical protein
LTSHYFLYLKTQERNVVFSWIKSYKDRKLSKIPDSTYKLIDLVPKENILKNGKDVRMFHGTKMVHWKNIKKQGIQPVGGGSLGKGFYFTPSVARATDYLFRQKKEQKKKNSEKELAPVLIELTIKDANTLTVGDLESEFPIKTNPFENQTHWQFIVTSPIVIKQYFRYDRVYKLDT